MRFAIYKLLYLCYASIYCSSVAGILFLISINSLIAQEPQSGRELLDQAIARRYDWHTAHVKINTFSDSDKKPSACWEVFLNDSRQMKGIVSKRCLTGENASLDTLCRNCYESDTTVMYKSNNSPDAAERALVIYSDELLPRNIGWIPDPHTIGLIPQSIYLSYNTNVASYYGSISEKFLISDDTIDETPCIRLTYDGSTSDSAVWTKVDIWIDTRDSKSVIKAQLFSKIPEGDIHDEVRTHYTKVDNKWVPSSCEYFRTKSGKEVLRDLVEFEFLSVDQPLPADTFTLAGTTGLKPNTRISWVMPKDRLSPFPGKNLIWNGKEIISEQTQIASEELPPRPLSVFFWLNTVLVFSLILLFLIRRTYLRHKTR